MKTIIVLNSKFSQSYGIFFFHRIVYINFLFITKKSLMKKCVFIFCYIIFSLKTVACQITGFVLQQWRNEDTLVQIWPFKSSKNKSKQTLYTEVVAQRCYVKKVFLKCSQNLLENSARFSFLIKFQAWDWLKIV